MPYGDLIPPSVISTYCLGMFVKLSNDELEKDVKPSYPEVNVVSVDVRTIPIGVPSFSLKYTDIPVELFQ